MPFLHPMRCISFTTTTSSTSCLLHLLPAPPPPPPLHPQVPGAACAAGGGGGGGRLALRRRGLPQAGVALRHPAAPPAPLGVRPDDQPVQEHAVPAARGEVRPGVPAAEGQVPCHGQGGHSNGTETCCCSLDVLLKGVSVIGRSYRLLRSTG